MAKQKDKRMRITGGYLKGRAVYSRQDRSLRPTSSRIREAIFNILVHGRFQFHDDFIEPEFGDFLQDKDILDVFCGTGAIGFECLSRGANSVSFVDKNHDTINVARKNAKELDVIEKCKFIRSDSTNISYNERKHHLVFMDPPYRTGLGAKAIENLSKNDVLQDNALIILEHEKHDIIPSLEEFPVLDDRVYDKTRITLMQYQKK